MFLAASVKNKNSNNSLQCITRWTRVNKVINWFRVLSGNLLNEGKTTAIIALALKYTHLPIYTICRYIWLGEKQQLQGDGRTRTLLWLKTKGNLAPKWQARKLYDFWLGFHVVGAVFGNDANWAQQKKNGTKKPFRTEITPEAGSKPGNMSKSQRDNQPDGILKAPVCPLAISRVQFTMKSNLTKKLFALPSN